MVGFKVYVKKGKYRKVLKEGQKFWHDDHPWSKAIKRDIIQARLKYLEGYKEKLQLNFDNYAD